jgi:hypothetical protein
MRNAKVIYDMPFEDYRAVEALSYSAVKEIATSISDWLYYRENPKPDTEALTVGKAYHEALLYGWESFEQKYCAPFSLQEGVQCLNTVDDMKDYCDKNLINRKGLKLKDDFKNAILENGSNVLFLDDLKEAHYAGREQISQADYDQLKGYYDFTQSIRDTKESTEVSIFWKEDGIPMKARFDALTHKGIIDIKTLCPKRGTFKQSIIHEIMGRMYHVQGAMYKRAYKAAGFSQADPEFILVFFKKGGGSEITNIALCKGNEYWDKAELAIDKAKELYRHYVMQGNKLSFSTEFSWLEDHEIPPYYLMEE